MLVTLAVLVTAVGVVLHFRDRRPRRNTEPLATTSSNLESKPPRASVFHSQPAPQAAESVPQPDDELAKMLAMKLPRETIEEYLRLHNRSAASLLAAFHASGDAKNPGGNLNYLKEAATNFPGDPRVQLAVLAHDAFPEARRQWLDAFKASSPSNSLGNYLSARDYFKNGQRDSAVKELLEATAKAQFEDFTVETFLGEKELYRTSGKTPLESNQAAMSALAGDLLPELSTSKGLAQSMRELQRQYTSAGDIASAENLAQVNLTLAGRLTGGESGKLIISQLVGLAIEAIALSQLDPNTSYAFLAGQTPNQRMEQLKQQKASIRALAGEFQAVFPTLTETEQENYAERARISGELAAMRWLVEQRGANTPSQGP